MSCAPIRVLIVDDSAVVRRLVREALGQDPAIEVIATASDPFAARDCILQQKPDVLTLDLEMPKMDGLTFLRILMKECPLPVIVMSSLTQTGSRHAMEALRLGAVDVLGKPHGSYSFGDLGPKLIAIVKGVARARLRRYSAADTIEEVAPQRTFAPVGQTNLRHDPRRIILLGASTGGTEALRDILTQLPPGLPPIAIVQHIPAGFSKAFADRLNSLCAFPVAEATDGVQLLPGTALVAPGNFHMMLRFQGGRYHVDVKDGPHVWHQRPAVDVLFRSLPDKLRPYAIAGVLTGMGRDGAEGLQTLRQSGTQTFSQDEHSCVVYGMPRAAWERGGSQRQIPLERIADHLINLSAESALPPVAASLPHALA